MNNIISIVLILSGLGLFLGYTNSLWNGDTGAPSFGEKSIKELKIDKQRYAESLERAREIEDVRNGLLTKYNAISEEDRKRIIKFLPEHVDSVRLIIDINNIAGAYGMSLNNIELSDEEKEQAPRKDELGILDLAPVTDSAAKILSFSLVGPYENFIAFLKDAERSLRLVDIVSVDISANDDAKNDDSSNYEYKVSLKTYYLSNNQ